MKYTIRPFGTTEEYRECVELQEATWGHGFSERVAPAILKVSQILGGVAAGAYATDGRLVGFVFGMTGQRHGEVVHWSDMLAVVPEARDSGLGRRLKAYQREEVMARGVEKMFWTFDPLQARNAHLNVNRLGIVIREYAENMYGDTDSPLHRGIGTDRFIALWLLPSQRVRDRLDGAEPDALAPTCPMALTAHDATDEHPRPAAPDTSLGTDTVGIVIPSDIGTVMDDELALAVEWRHATRAAFLHYLSSGYEVTGFRRGPKLSMYSLTLLPEDAR